ncbi:MAG TPA: response regulator [Phycisphaerae bacterium]|nr:response regulator [Phycisphaerae bacterium]
MQTIRVILFTSNETARPEMRRMLTSLPQVRIVAELDEPSLFSQAVTQIPADLLIADLDPSAAVVLECLRQLKESAPDLPVFALSSVTDGNVVLTAMRAGIKEYLLKPLAIEELEQAIGRTVGAAGRTKQPGKLISIMGSAGGVGCTTIAVNLAVELADIVGESQKVALVDLDFRFGHVATLLDVHGPHTVADLCSTPEQLDPDMVLKALVRHDSGLYVLRRPHTFAQAEMITAAHCANVLSVLQEICAYVIVDGPTRHDPGGRSVLDAADFSFLVLQLLVTSVRNTDRMVQELSAQGFNPKRIAFLCNRQGRESAHLEVEQVETILNRKLFMSIADDWKAVSSSVNIGNPLKKEFERSRVRQDIRNLAMKIHCPQLAVTETAQRGGLLGKFLRMSHWHGGTSETAPDAAVPSVPSKSDGMSLPGTPWS